jgi:hypothetical protein
LFEGLLLILFVALGIYTIAAVQDENRRTAEAPATIVATRPQLSVGRAPQEGLEIAYSFRSLDGETRVGEAFRLWTIEQVEAAKVCYEPADPANNVLVKPSLACPH